MAAQYQENNNTCIQRLTSFYDDETYSEEALTAPLSTLGDVINDTGNILDFFYDAVNQGDIGSTKKILCELLDQSKRCKKCMPDECKQVNVGIHFDLIAILDIEKLLCTAAQKRHVEILQLLLKSLPYDKLATGSKLLELALELKDAVIVKSVLDSGVDVDERINGSYIRWGSLVTYTFPLHEATSAGDEITVRMLIDYGAQLDFTDSDGNTAVMLACAGSSLDVLCLLLKAGADLDLTDFNDRSALVIAAALNKTDMMHLIFENGGQISERMLLRACEISSVSASALKLLLKGLRNGGFDIDWYRLLQTATHFNKPENVQVLLNHMPCTLKKAGPRAQDILTIALHKKHFLENTVNILFEEEFIKAEGVDSHGNQPLHVAVKYCSPEFCFKLSQAEDLDSADCAGMTPLMLCLYRDRHEDCGVSSAQTAATIIKQLLQQGANINVQDRSGCTSVHHAVIVGNSPALVVLVEAGADLTMCDENGKNPLDLAWSKAFSTHPFSPFRDLRSDISSGNDCLWVENEYLMVTRGQRLYLENRAEVMLSLLKAGVRFTKATDLEWILCTLLHFKLDHLIPWTVGRNIFPQDLVFRESTDHTDLVCTLDSKVSPFSLALYMGNFEIALFFFDTSFLTGQDLVSLNENIRFREQVAEKLTLTSKPVAQACQSLFSNCFSLQTLSFVRVSDLLGFQSGRENRVKNLGLPPSIQRKLLFQGRKT